MVYDGFANGSVSAPSIRGINFSTTGLYFATGKFLGALAGVKALELNADSIFLGSGAGAAITSGTDNILLGALAGKFLTTGADNVVIGYHALSNSASSSASSQNVLIGSFAGLGTTTGSQNTVVGYDAGESLTTATNNTIIGHAAARQMTTGGSGVYIGRGAANSNITGGFNTMVGHAPGYRYISGQDNCFFGDQAGNPTIAGDPDRTGSNNVAVGQLSGPTIAAGTNTVCIGDQTTTGISNTGKFGNALTDTCISGRLFSSCIRSNEATAAGVTYSVAQFCGWGKLISRSGPGAPFNDTTPTAAAIVAAIPGCEVNSGYEFTINNVSGQALTLLAGAGVTQSGIATIATGFSRRYHVQVTNIGSGTEALVVTSLGAGTL